MTKHLPISFFAPLPGIWQIFFWGTASLLSLLPALTFLNDPEPNRGGAVVGFLVSAFFIGFGVATWIERRWRQQPALIVTSDGLSFWPGLRREKFLPWSQLEKAWVSGGSDSQLVFQPRDLKRYASRTLLFFRTGPSVPIKTATRDGVMLADVLETLWDQCDPARNKISH